MKRLIFFKQPDRPIFTVASIVPSGLMVLGFGVVVAPLFLW